MSVIIGSARIDENGNASGGRAGDNNGKEVSTQNWYLHNKGWVVIRAKSDAVRKKIAQDMQYACDNPCIGYDQSQNRTLFEIVKKLGYDCSKVHVDCETDCAQLVRVCVLYAGIKCDDFYTATEISVLSKTGAFDVLWDEKYCKHEDLLKAGDILCTPVKGHTVVVLTDGAGTAYQRKMSMADVPILEVGMIGHDVVAMQALLYQFGYNLGSFGIDGEFGSSTLKALKKFQSEHGMNADGVCGKKTWKALING